MKMMLMSVFYHRVPIMHRVAIFPEDMTASVNQGILDGCARRTLMNACYPRVKTVRLAKMEKITMNAAV